MGKLAQSSNDPIMSLPSGFRMEATHGDQDPFMKHLCWRPPLDGRISIALPLTLAGQKGPIFPKKIGASG
ncbi:MAG: hypothetical protein ACTIKE_10155, partial [Sphingobacterium sp.]